MLDAIYSGMKTAKLIEKLDAIYSGMKTAKQNSKTN
jgi:hypothetical protein